MNLALTYCWKEWRSQRGVLVAFTALGLASLCLLFLLLPQPWWLEDGRRALALSWFVAIGVIGVVGFVAPALVRNEFGSKDDQFVRRLPGALWPSFQGKLLFLLLVALGLPLVCLLAGQGFLLAIGQDWHDLFAWDHAGTVWLRWPWPAPMLGYAALLATWVWAIGTWLPGGRMALGGTILMLLLFGLGILALLNQSPGIAQGIAWSMWLWAIPVLGALTAGLSWTKGRRGGGPWRSARYGLLTLALGCLPPALWFAERSWDYHHPDLQRLVELDVQGMTPDLRYVLARGNAHESYSPVPIRIDLQAGRADQLAGIATWFCAGLLDTGLAGLALARHWRCIDNGLDNERVGRQRVLDLATLAGRTVPFDPQTWRLEVPAGLRAAEVAEVRATTPLRAPGDTRVWFDGPDLCFQGLSGDVQRQPWPGLAPRSVVARGHGMATLSGGQRQLYDLHRRTPVAIEKWQHGLFVRGTAVFVREGGRQNEWWRQRGAEPAEPFPTLKGLHVLGLVDDDHLLAASYVGGKRDRLLLVHVADASTSELAVPAGLPTGTSVHAVAPLHEAGSLLARDPTGSIWLAMGNRTSTTFLRLDAKSRAITVAFVLGDHRLGWELLGWPDPASVLVRRGAAIERIDTRSGAATRLFPR